MQNQPRLKYVNCFNKVGVYRMAYWEWGDPSNSKVLLCVHGLTRNGRDFDDLAKSMQNEYRVICPDIVGRGKSDYLADGASYTVPKYVADILTLIARIEPSELAYIGTSMGGLIGLGLAGISAAQMQGFGLAKNPLINHEQSFIFNKFILNDVGPVLEPESLERIGSYVGIPQRYSSFEEAVQKTKERSPSFGPLSQDGWEKFTRVGLIEHNGVWQENYDLNIAKPFESEASADSQKNAEIILWESFKNITCPTLILRGETSDLLSKKTAQSMLALNQQARLVEIPEVGHAPTLIPKQQIQIVKDFLIQTHE